MRVLLTGANGHIGANTARSLMQRDYEVVAFVREGADLQGLEGLNVTLRYGDIRDASSLIAAAEGCDVIIHCAAVYNLLSESREEIIEPVLAGVENVFRAMEANKIRRLVFTSSGAAVGFSHSQDEPRTPADWHTEAQNLYVVAKVESERKAIQLAEQYGVDMIRLLPSAVLGPYDYRITPSNGIILGMANGLTTTWEGGLNVVDVREVAEVHAAAVTMGEPGQRYIIGGENMHALEMGEIVAEFTGVRPDHSDADRATTKAMVAEMEAEAKISGESMTTSSSIVHELTERYGYFDTSLTNETFDLQPRSGRETLLACLQWLDSLGMLETARAMHLLHPS
jgi:dihydroflavonol-4-reductase